MIDTVKLRIDNPNIPSEAYDAFEPSAKDLFVPPFPKGKLFKRKLKPSKDDERKGLYLPRITLYKAVRSNGYAIYLEIEFSAPKILFNNNFEEISDSDFNRLCIELSHKIESMGLKIKPDGIANAHVQIIHYGKNILTGYTLATAVISDISKANITSVKDFTEKEYRGGGKSLYFHTLNHGVVFYDKVAELNRSKCRKRGLIEKDYYCQKSLFDDRAPPKPFEIVRMEARYSGKPQIRKLATRLGLDLLDDYRFAGLFSSIIAQSALQYELEEIKRGNFAFADSDAETLADFIQQIKLLNPKCSNTCLMKAITLWQLSHDGHSSREIRTMLGLKSAKWYRLREDVKSLKYTKRVANGISIIEQGLNDFTTVRLPK